MLRSSNDRLMDVAEESSLVMPAQNGDFHAFDLLVRNCERRAWTVAWRLLGDKEEVENVVQTSFLKAMEALETFRGESRFCTWVGKIVTRTGLDMLRSRKRKEGCPWTRCLRNPTTPPSPTPSFWWTGGRTRRAPLNDKNCSPS